MSDLDLGAILDALPIFPLPRTVLLPGAMLPLHIFEPRYRDLAAHCVDNGRIMGVATLLPGHGDDADGRPAIAEHVGIGRMVAHQVLPDGRSNLVLHYIARAVIRRELDPRHAFREVAVDLLPEVEEPSPSALLGLRGMVARLGGASPAAADEVERLLDTSGMALADELAAKILPDTADRLAYLAAEEPGRRIDLVEGALAEVLVRATAGEVVAEA